MLAAKLKWLFFLLLVLQRTVATPLGHPSTVAGDQLAVRASALATGKNQLPQLVAAAAKSDPPNVDSNEADDDDNDKDGDTSKEDATAGASESVSKSDASQPDDQSDDTSESKEDSGSKSNSATEEEGDSSSESNTTEEQGGKSDSDEEKESEEPKPDKSDSKSVSDTTEEDEDESVNTSESSLEDSDQSEENDHKLLIILLNGVRPEFISRDEKKLKTFSKIVEEGVHAKQVRPVFPANPLPNSYSIATGKYPSKHGIINDYIYDKQTKALFDGKAADPKAKEWWSKSEPIWLTAKKSNKNVHMVFWPGCEVEINKKRPTSCEPFKDLSGNDKGDELVSERLTDILNKFAKDDYDLAMVYYNAIGGLGEKYGPDNRKVVKAMRAVDSMLDKLKDEIEKKNLQEKLNVIILSDHGMTQSKKTINLEKYVDFNDLDKVVGDGAFVMLQPEKRKTDDVYDQLLQASVRGLNVYRRERLPKKLHIKESDRVLPIVLTADEGFVIDTPDIKNKVYPEGKPSERLGHFGYDPDHVDEMMAVFYGFGPDLREGYEVENLRNIDYYNLFCHLLGIKSKPNDGQWGRVQKLLRSDESSEEETKESDESGSDEDDGASVAGMAGSLIVLAIVQMLIFT